MPQIKEAKNREVDIVAKQLYEALKIYKSKIGTYELGFWKTINEKRVASATNIITSLLLSYERYDNLTNAQIKLAEKLITNSKKLT